LGDQIFSQNKKKKKEKSSNLGALCCQKKIRKPFPSLFFFQFNVPLVSLPGSFILPVFKRALP